MDTVNIQHQALADGRWTEMTFAAQMANIGSEISRSLKAKEKGKQERMEKAAGRALELFDLTISAWQRKTPEIRLGKLKELCRGREEFCDFIYGDNSFHTDPRKLMRYYDQFVSISR